MSLFSSRQGYRQTKQIQYEEVNDQLRTALWNLLTQVFWRHVNVSRNIGVIGSGGRILQGPVSSALLSLWETLLTKTTDTFPSQWHKLHPVLKKHFFMCEWFEVYDFLEFMYPYADDIMDHGSHLFQLNCNVILERECSAYRFIDGKIVPITSASELSEIEQAMEVAPKNAQEHLETAIQLFASRTDPDYRNSIKESISAVEAVAKLSAGAKGGTLADAIDILRGEKRLHPAFLQGLDKIYGYTSDANGIRHALMDEASLSASDARFMLVMCSAFVNYLLEKTQGV